jgi:hypothetical protein
LHRISLRYAPYNSEFIKKIGAARGIRTPDLRITKQAIVVFAEYRKFLGLAGATLRNDTGWSAKLHKFAKISDIEQD